MSLRKSSGMWDESQLVMCKGIIILCFMFNLIFTTMEITKIGSLRIASFANVDYYVHISFLALMLGIFIPILLYVICECIRACYSNWCLECYLYRGTSKICPHCRHKRLFGDELLD